MTMLKTRAGQGTTEYIMVAALILGVLLIVARDGGVLNNAIRNLFTSSSNWLNSVANSLP